MSMGSNSSSSKPDAVILNRFLFCFSSLMKVLRTGSMASCCLFWRTRSVASCCLFLIVIDPSSKRASRQFCSLPMLIQLESSFVGASSLWVPPTELSASFFSLLAAAFCDFTSIEKVLREDELALAGGRRSLQTRTRRGIVLLCLLRTERCTNVPVGPRNFARTASKDRLSVSSPSTARITSPGRRVFWAGPPCATSTTTVAPRTRCRRTPIPASCRIAFLSSLLDPDGLLCRCACLGLGGGGVPASACWIVVSAGSDMVCGALSTFGFQFSSTSCEGKA
mmetsp:Transcript_51957/g.161612  ORF Transcript_51957/g.161612 Transcript_51957/m.161612 type:complete len:280 (-) Transcript_51957:362-1201(-)